MPTISVGPEAKILDQLLEFVGTSATVKVGSQEVTVPTERYVGSVGLLVEKGFGGMLRAEKTEADIA